MADSNGAFSFKKKKLRKLQHVKTDLDHVK